MSERPHWTMALQAYISDTILDDPSYTDDDDPLLEEIETSVRAILCAKYGHEIEDDQCMIPEHRYCIWCHQRATTLGLEP